MLAKAPTLLNSAELRALPRLGQRRTAAQIAGVCVTPVWQARILAFQPLPTIPLKRNTTHSRCSVRTVRTVRSMLMYLAVACVLGACVVAPKSTGVTELGQDRYQITARGTLGVPSESRTLAMSQADAFCADKGRAMQVTETGKAPLSGPYQLTFECKAEDNPEGGKPVVKRPPTAVQPVN